MRVVIPGNVIGRDARFFTEGAIYPVLEVFDFQRRYVVRGDDGSNVHLPFVAFHKGNSRESWKVKDVRGEDLLTVAVRMTTYGHSGEEA